MSKKVRVKGHTRTVGVRTSAGGIGVAGHPSTLLDRQEGPTFKSRKGGHVSHGTVKEIRHHGGGGVMVRVKHGKLKTGKDGLFSDYDHEASFHLPKSAAKKYRVGDKVDVSLRIRNGDARGNAGNPAKAGDSESEEHEQGRETHEDESDFDY